MIAPQSGYVVIDPEALCPLCQFPFGDDVEQIGTYDVRQEGDAVVADFAHLRCIKARP